MKKSQLLIIVTLLALLLAINQFSSRAAAFRHYLGGLPWYGWAGISAFLIFIGLAFALRDALHERRLLEEPVEIPPDPNAQRVQLSKELLEKYDLGVPITKELLEKLDPDGPEYPHPVVIAELCIGCQACVDACPHDVLAMVGNLAVPVARDQCAEDTSCQVECPVNPKACIVVNTTKVIKPRPVPVRDKKFMTNVPGCYIIGEVSGNPLLKKAANEGADVIMFIAEELRNAPPEPKAKYDVAIIGIGPAGLSAAVVAKRYNLHYIGIEQAKVLATIEAYPKNKDLFFKPDTMEAKGGIPIEGARAKRERILELWLGTMMSNGVVINEEESCKAVKPATDGDYFIVETEKGVEGQPCTYRARRVVIALGTRGTPKELDVEGKEIKITRNGRAEDKVMYKLSNPDAFKGKKIVVVGGGNSAVETAIALVARRDGDQIEFRPPEEINEVTLVVRTDFKNDVKFGNKQHIYRCIDGGKVNVYFGTSIKEIHESEVVLMNTLTKEEIETVANDYIFALIGSDRPTSFLEKIGIHIPKE